MALAGSWRPGQNLVYGRSITAASIAARQPTGFKSGSPVAKVSNRGATDVLIVFYNFATLAADPTLVFPVDGAPPTGQGSGQVATLVPAGTTAYVDGIALADSFAAIGSAAGPALVYVQRGDGNGP